MKKPRCLPVFLSAALGLSLTGCFSQPTVSVTPVTPSVEPVSQMSTETAKPEDNNLHKIWGYLGEDMQEFADNFSEHSIFGLKWSFAGEAGVTNYNLYNAEDIRRIFDALDAITVEDPVTQAADDFEDTIIFTKFDETEYTIRFNMHNLEVGKDHYAVSGDADLWNLLDAVTENLDPAFDSTAPAKPATTTPTPGAEPTPTVTAAPTDEPVPTKKPTQAPTAAPTQTPTAEENSAGRWTWTYEEYQDGSAQFCFDDLLIVKIPSSWKDKYFLYLEDEESNTISFYHKASYDKYMEAYGSPGGHLFTIGYFPDKSYEQAPHYLYLGLAEDGYYAMLLPTDVQGWMEDPEIWAEWQMMNSEMGFVEDNAYSMLFS